MTPRARSSPSTLRCRRRRAITDALAGFVGTFEQRPPAFSARKVAGRTAYRAARAGEPIDLPPRTVTVDSIEVLEISPGEGWLDVRIDLRCAPGTYVRSIARDLGERLGTGAHLHALRRTEAAGLLVAGRAHARSARGAGGRGSLAEAVRPVGELLPLPAVSLDSDGAWRFVHGAAQPATMAHRGRVKVLDAAGELIGVGSLAAGELRPEKVVPQGPDA